MAVSRLKKNHLFKNTAIINKNYYAVHVVTSFFFFFLLYRKNLGG